jgi:sulfite reductase (ferredoxin)
MRDWGPERFREELEKTIGYALEDLEDSAPLFGRHREHLGVWPQKDGNSYVGFAPKAGRIAGHQLGTVARLAKRLGKGRVRTTSQQKMVILDVPEASVQTLVEELGALDLPVEGSNWRKGTMACTGIEFCKLAIVETKGRAVELYRYLEERLPGAAEEVRINVNGCPNSCARYQTADIGLMGCVVPEKIVVVGPDGRERTERRKVEAFLVHLGGQLGTDAAFGRKVRGVKVFASELGPYVETLIRRYRTRRRDGETFARFVAGLPEDELQRFGAKPVFAGLPPAPTVLAEPRAS